MAKKIVNFVRVQKGNIGSRSPYPQISFFKVNGHFGLNVKARNLLDSKRVHMFVDADAKIIAFQATKDSDGFIINPRSGNCSSVGLTNLVQLKKLPKVLNGQWDDEIDALVFDYGKIELKKGLTRI